MNKINEQIAEMENNLKLIEEATGDKLLTNYFRWKIKQSFKAGVEAGRKEKLKCECCNVNEKVTRLLCYKCYKKLTNEHFKEGKLSAMKEELAYLENLIFQEIKDVGYYEFSINDKIKHLKKEIANANPRLTPSEIGEMEHGV